MCVCVCVRACVHACVRACVCVHAWCVRACVFDIVTGVIYVCEDSVTCDRCDVCNDRLTRSVCMMPVLYSCISVHCNVSTVLLSFQSVLFVQLLP